MINFVKLITKLQIVLKVIVSVDMVKKIIQIKMENHIHTKVLGQTHNLTVMVFFLNKMEHIIMDIL